MTNQPAAAASLARWETSLDDFDSVVRVYQPTVFRFALASLRDRDAAETVTQDCFVRAYRSRDRFRNECSVHTWLMRIAVNLIRDHARNRKLQFWKRLREQKEPFEELSARMGDGALSAEKQALIKEQVRSVWDAAARLPERQRAVFLLRFVEDMDLLEIASATGLKEGTVKVHLSRALQSVRETIGASV